jgi:alanine dehydrogenase
VLFLNNDDVQSLLAMPDCIRVQEEAFLGLDDGRSMHRPRIDLYAPCELDDGYWRWGSMEGSTSAPGPYFAIRMKSDVIRWSEDPRSGLKREDKYCGQSGTYCGLIMLFSTCNGLPLAMINDGHLQHMRVGGGAGVGAKYLARQDARSVGMLGSGGMARTYLEALLAVRPIEHVRVYSPNPDNRLAYARETSERFGIEVEPVDHARDAVRGADIVASCTSSMVSTIDPDWIEPGMHITNLGPFELSEAFLESADVVIRQGIAGGAVSGSEQGPRLRMGVGHSPLAYIAGTDEEMTRLPPPQPQTLFRRDFPDFNDVATGRVPGRTSNEQVTVYINGGNQGLQFACVAGLTYEAARAAGKGRELPTEWFLQSIRD